MTSREKIEKKEASELVKRKAQLSRKPLKFALLFAAIAILLGAGIDAIATQIGGQLQSSIVTEFFVEPYHLSYNEAVSRFSAVNIISYLILPVLPFYKALSDKFGRKPFLAFNIIMMGVGMALCAWSPSVFVFYVGYTIIVFMVSSDMQIIYLYEVAPQKKRATFYGFVKGTGAFCIVLVPVLRATVMGNDSTLWRNVYAIPAVLAFAIAAYILLVPRESEMFLKQRVKYLELPYEQRHPGKKNKTTEKKNKSGVFHAMKHLFKEKQLFWLTIISMVFATGSMAFSSYVESIMTNFGMTTEAVTAALMLYPFMNMFITWIAGFVSDKVGRKPIIVTAGILAVGGFICFNVSAFLGASPHLVGFFYGLYLPCWWQVVDFASMMMAESTPTYNRASVLAAASLLRLIGQALGLLIPIIAPLLFKQIGFGYMVSVVPPVVIGLVLLIWKVKDTNGVDLNTIGD
jgi:MFS family permease